MSVVTLPLLSSDRNDANGAVSGVADGVGIVGTFVAHEFATAGPGAQMVREAAILEVGRAIGILQLALTQIESTAFGLAEIAMGALVLFAPAGALNPPRLFGWAGLGSGAAGSSLGESSSQTRSSRS